jgi:hypothetical protein
MDPNNPREAWNRFQSALQRAQQHGAGRGPSKGGLGMIAGAVLLGGAALVGSNALFNGTFSNYQNCVFSC